MTYIGSGLLALFGLLMVIGGALSQNFARGFREGIALDASVAMGALTAILVIAGIVLLALAAALITFAIFSQGGKNWARITLTAIGGIVCAFQLVSIANGSTGTIIGLIYIGTATVLPWLGTANQWYRSVKVS